MGHSQGPQTGNAELAIPDLVNYDDGLSEEEAVVLALWNNAAYRALLADLDVADADVLLACQLPNPEITTMFPLSAKQWEFTMFLPLDALVLRPQRVNAARLEKSRISERLVQDGLNVISDARLAHINLVQAEAQLEISRNNEALLAELARIANARLEAGAVSELDISALRLAALVAKGQLARDTQDLELARQQLRFVLGMLPGEPNVSSTEFAAPEDLELDVELLQSWAETSRPDLHALDLAISAANTRARLAKFDYLNLWAGLPDTNADGEKGFEAGPGLRMSVPIFHQNQGNIARANAESARLSKQRNQLRQEIALQVQQAYTQWQQAQEQLQIWRDQIIPVSKETIAAARKGLEEDVAPLLLVLETTRQQQAAQQGALQAAADVRRAAVELERSVGKRLFVPPALSDDEPPPAPEPKPISVSVES